jgi:hypothetical protein
MAKQAKASVAENCASCTCYLNHECTGISAESDKQCHNKAFFDKEEVVTLRTTQEDALSKLKRLIGLASNFPPNLKRVAS